MQFKLQIDANEFGYSAHLLYTTSVAVLSLQPMETINARATYTPTLILRLYCWDFAATAACSAAMFAGGTGIGTALPSECASVSVGFKWLDSNGV